jgi:hypothetical protein
MRVANQNLPPGHTASYVAQIDVKKKYDTGEWSVPCYSLRCVGFNFPLYQALCGASSGTQNGAAPAESDAQLGTGKRRKSIGGDAKNKKARSSPHDPRGADAESKGDQEGNNTQ